MSALPAYKNEQIIDIVKLTNVYFTKTMNNRYIECASVIHGIINCTDVLYPSLKRIWYTWGIP